MLQPILGLRGSLLDCQAFLAIRGSGVVFRAGCGGPEARLGGSGVILGGLTGISSRSWVGDAVGEIMITMENEEETRDLPVDRTSRTRCRAQRTDAEACPSPSPSPRAKQLSTSESVSRTRCLALPVTVAGLASYQNQPSPSAPLPSPRKYISHNLSYIYPLLRVLLRR